MKDKTIGWLMLAPVFTGLLAAFLLILGLKTFLIFFAVCAFAVVLIVWILFACAFIGD